VADARIVSCLQALAPLQGLSLASIKSFASAAQLRRVSAGECVWRRGEHVHHFIGIVDGLVALQQVSAAGEVSMVALFGPGDALCAIPLLYRQLAPADAVAVCDQTELVFVPSALFLRTLETEPTLLAAVNRTLADHAALLRRKIELVSAGSVPRRVAALVLYLAERLGTAEGGQVCIRPALTREQIGQLVNARTETVIRIMSRWQKVGWIRGSAPVLEVLRMDMLRRIASGAQPASPRGDLG
jgi:CRP-like cAMP-binding protein